jgi:hypothetical protein
VATNIWFATAAVAVGLLGAGPERALADQPPTPIVSRLETKAVLSGDDLLAIAALIEGGAHPDLSTLIGKPIRVVIIPDNTTDQGPRFWYDAAHQALGLHAPIGQLSGRFVEGAACATGEMTARGIEIARNGPAANLSPQTSDVTHVLDRPEQHRVSLGELACTAGSAPSGLNMTLNESRQRADRQISSLQVTIQGVLRAANGPNLVVCGGERIEPTLSQPLSLTLHQCVVGASIERIAFSADGVDLASWSGLPNGNSRGRRRPSLKISAQPVFH